MRVWAPWNWNWADHDKPVLREDCGHCHGTGVPNNGDGTTECGFCFVELVRTK